MIQFRQTQGFGFEQPKRPSGQKENVDMDIGKSSTFLQSYGGASWTNGVGQYPDTDLHLRLIETACNYREQSDCVDTSAQLVRALSAFAKELGIFRPIVEVWEEIRKIFRLPEGSLPNRHEEAGKRGIHISPSYVERERDGLIERATIVLSENLAWGIVWTLNTRKVLWTEQSDESLFKHYTYEPASPEEIATLGFNPGGGGWGMTNSLLREAAIARDRAEKRYRDLFGLVQSLIIAEQITNLNNTPETSPDDTQ